MSIGLDEIKRQAYVLVDFLRQEYQDTDFYVTDMMDIMSRLHGYEDWNHAVKMIDDEE